MYQIEKCIKYKTVSNTKVYQIQMCVKLKSVSNIMWQTLSQTLSQIVSQTLSQIVSQTVSQIVNQTLSLWLWIKLLVKSWCESNGTVNQKRNVHQTKCAPNSFHLPWVCSSYVLVGLVSSPPGYFVSIVKPTLIVLVLCQAP